MNNIEVRTKIQEAGHELYEKLGKTSKNLQYLAGELMNGNEEYVIRLMNAYHPMTYGANNILKYGFTVNQIAFLSELETELLNKR